MGVFRLQRRVPIVEGDLREHRGRRVRLFWTFLGCFFWGTRRLYLLRKGVEEETARRLLCFSKEENLLLIFVCLILVFSRMSCILVAHGV